MISIDMANQLRGAGLAWRPAEHDRFVLAEHGMDEQIFVLSALPAIIQRYNGYPVVAFQASPEWALDYVMLGEVLWLPSESQLRDAIAERLALDTPLRLERDPAGYRCTIAMAGQTAAFSAATAEEAYGLTLLALLEHEPRLN